MFLLERMIGICIFFVILIIVSNLISKCLNIKETKKILMLYIFILSVLGYFFCPYKSADLYYIKNLINTNLINKNFRDIFVMFQDLGYQLYYIYYWIFGKLGNTNLLPAVTAMFFYSNIFYILYKSCDKFGLSPKTMSRTLLFFMAGGQFLEVISGIKSMFAFSVVALCCYKEFFENKSFLFNLPLYLFAALMHDAALVAVGIRFVYLIFQKEDRIIYKIGHYIIFGIFLLFTFKYGKEIIISASSKGQHYINAGAYSNIWEYVIAIICDCFMLYSICLVNNVMKNDLNLKEKMSTYVKYVVMVLMIDICFVFEYSIFHRYRSFTMMIIIPIIALLFEKTYRKEYSFLKKYYLIFQIYFMLTMGIALSRGNLASLKFFDLSSW